MWPKNLIVSKTRPAAPSVAVCLITCTELASRSMTVHAALADSASWHSSASVLQCIFVRRYVERPNLCAKTLLHKCVNVCLVVFWSSIPKSSCYVWWLFNSFLRQQKSVSWWAIITTVCMAALGRSRKNPGILWSRRKLIKNPSVQVPVTWFKYENLPPQDQQT